MRRYWAAGTAELGALKVGCMTLLTSLGIASRGPSKCGVMPSGTQLSSMCPCGLLNLGADSPQFPDAHAERLPVPG